MRIDQGSVSIKQVVESFRRKNEVKACEYAKVLDCEAIEREYVLYRGPADSGYM